MDDIQRPAPGEAELLWPRLMSLGLTLAAVAFLVAHCARDEYLCRFKGFHRGVQVVEGREFPLEPLDDLSHSEWAYPVAPLWNRGGAFGKDGIPPYNAVSYRQCGENPGRGFSIRYQELRDPRIASLILSSPSLLLRGQYAWRRGKLGDRMGPASDRKWRHEYLAGWPPLPDWLPAADLNDKTFLGFLDRGFLFKGARPGQYFWIRASS